MIPVNLQLKVNVLLVPKIASRHVYFNKFYYFNNKWIGYERSDYSGSWGESFCHEYLFEYIISDDKKEYRNPYLNRIQDYLKPDLSYCYNLYQNLSEHPSDTVLIPNKIATIPIYICPTCARVFDHPKVLTYCWSDVEKFIDQPTHKFRRCKICMDKKYRSQDGKIILTSFLSNFNKELWCHMYHIKKDPRAFIYEKEQKKDFFSRMKKCAIKHLSKVKRFRAINKSEINFFRALLGARELTKISNQ